jgi:hypothetical protein
MMLKLRIWARAETTLLKINARRTGNRFTALAGANGLLAAVVVFFAQRSKPGLEEEMVNEIREMALAELQTDADEIKEEFDRIAVRVKQGANQELRDAVAAARENGHEIDVRVTWEAGDSGLFAAQAAKEGIDTVIAGGGDGTVNEVLNGLAQADGNTSALGVIPLGTANDFARSAGIPLQLEAALRVAVETEPVAVDVGRSGDRAFMNVATGGFGTEVTVNTDPKLKRMGHEIAHAEKRHGSVRLQKEYGAKALTKLKETGDDVGIPEILSDHPDSGSRIREIQKEAKRLGCST